MMITPDKDLVMLFADSEMRAAVVGLLTRPKALGIRPLSVDTPVHPARDPGVRHGARDFLRGFVKTHRYALVLLDHEGSGAEQLTPAHLEADIEKVCTIDWGDRMRAIAIAPELETWVWSDSPEVDQALGWGGRLPSLRDWLISEHWLSEKQLKPDRPKEAFDAAIRQVRKPRSARIFEALGENVSVNRCQDRAFLKLRDTLAGWFADIPPR